MEPVPLSKIFDIKYGNQFDLNKMEFDVDGINFVSRTSQNLGIVAKVTRYKDVDPYSAGKITVTLGGTYLLSAFVQLEDFYTAQNIKILTPLRPMNEAEKIYYCIAIGRNRFRYSSHGREANVTLDRLLVPERMPDSWSNFDIQKFDISRRAECQVETQLNQTEWKYFELTRLFTISASKDKLIDELTEGGTTPYITSSDSNNGVTSFVKELPTNLANTITANRGGSVGYFYYQPMPYQATPVDVRILTPKFDMNAYTGLFLKTILQKESYRYNYSRKMGSDRLAQFRIKLPAKDGMPNWDFMERYIKSLPYSCNIA